MSLLNNAKWNFFSQSFKILAQLVNVVYLAKIIPPAEYGIMAMAMVIINLGTLLRDLGTSAAIIQRKELTDKLVNTVFWLNVVMGVGLFIIVILSSTVISNIYHQPKLFYVLIMLSVVFPLSSCASAHLALLERESKFRKISIIEVSSSLVSVIIAIVMANMGFGVYSLVAQAVVINAMSAIQFWIASTWRPSIRSLIDFDELKQIFGFSANLSLFNFINYFSRNADSFIIGKFMNATILGSYNLGYRIMLFPLQSLTFVAARSLYPILSKSQDDNSQISKIYLNCIFVILLITAPLMSGLAFYSVPFIKIIFGEQWHLTADILKWLAPTAIIQSVLSTAGSVFMAKGRTDILMKLGIVGAILQVSAFMIGVNYNISIFSMCYLIANIINFFPVMFLLMKVINGTFVSLLYKICPILTSVVAMILSLKMISVYFPVVGITTAFQLISFSMLGALVYFIAMLMFSSYFRRAVLKKIKI
ncbi:lipopolysaccharide biosynthesis protein [Raoultella terrigena]|uniref:lipopolysaccharide biosynthesis protein n=1 Tax=Raoultella terrigena TaxID=577 RepID=UPI0025B0F555|nr:lipopolysaccharide biosynthesis protein [Raoultella terrigena]WJV40598.1 lipopolysaccharide biosynthesis protein [Raoultella terrigena]